MRIFAALCLFVSQWAFAAQNSCDKYRNSERYMKAIEAVAQQLDTNLEALCSSQNIWDIEAQPSRKVTYQGEVQPMFAYSFTTNMTAAFSWFATATSKSRNSAAILVSKTVL